MFEVKPISFSFSPFASRDVEFSPLSVALILLIAAAALSATGKRKQ